MTETRDWFSLCPNRIEKTYHRRHYCLNKRTSSPIPQDVQSWERVEEVRKRDRLNDRNKGLVSQLYTPRGIQTMMTSLLGFIHFIQTKRKRLPCLCHSVYHICPSLYLGFSIINCIIKLYNPRQIRFLF